MHNAQPMIEMPAPELMAALHFTADDLAANRAGVLSDAQRERLRRSSRPLFYGVMALALALMIGAALLIYLGRRGEPPILSLIGVSLTAINAVVLAVGVGSRLRLGEDLRTGRVVRLSGIVRRVVRVNRRAAAYVLVVELPEGALRLNVSKAVFNSFQDGARYHLYRTASARLLVAAEMAR
jgi:hypothetical protein